MSEMLGNQYFMARKYSATIPEFEEVLTRSAANKDIKKKLIICYVQTGKIDKAMHQFYDLIREDIEYVIKSDPIEDDCPCSELVANLKNSTVPAAASTDYYKTLGILCLYCDASESLEYFQKLKDMNNNNYLINSIIKLINNYLQQNKTTNSSN